MRLAHLLKSHRLDEVRDMRKPRPHIGGQRLYFRIYDFIQCFDNPLHN
jgi:hypothetical protein